MIPIEWSAVGLGALTGAVAGTLFFAGLAFGLRQALRSARPGAVLLASGVLRITAMAGLGWLVARSGAIALAAFALAFMGTRLVAVALAGRPSARPLARPPTKPEASSWN